MRLSSTPVSRRLIALACAIGATGVAASSALALIQPAAASPSAAGTPRCAGSGLVIWLDTQGNGAAGSIYYQLELTNLSGRTCTLRGYPGVSAVNIGGGQLGRAAARESGKTPRTVTLANGAGATVTLRIVEAGNFPNSVCRATLAAGLRVYPPGLSASKLVPFPFEACSRSGPTFLSVGPVQKSSG